MAVSQANKNGIYSFDLSLVALDTQDHVLLVKGDETRLHVRGQLRGFLQAERAKYIAQIEAEDDDDATAMGAGGAL